MQQTIINLKQKIDKNYKKLHRKYPPTKVVLEEIDKLISQNSSDKIIDKWLEDHDNIIFSLEYHLNLIENVD